MNTTATAYNFAGHVCPQTGRLAMTVADAYARPDMPDRHFCLYDAESENYGMDPWRLLDGMDMTTGTPVVYTLDFPNGRSINVQGSTIVYMQRTKAEREPRYIVDLEGPSGIRVTMRGVGGKDATEAVVCARAHMAEPSDWSPIGIDRAPAT